MGITVPGHYGLQGGTAGSPALTMVPPAGVTAAGDKIVLYVADKPSSIDPVDPATWRRAGSAEVGTGADGDGTGKIRLSVWEQELTAAAGNTGINIIGSNRCLGGGTVLHKDAGDPPWNPIKVSFGSDIVSDATFAALMADNLDLQPGEILISFGAFTAIVSLLGRGITIPGVTSTITNVNSAGGAVGNKIFVWTDYRQSTSGTQSGASTTNATAGTATTGGAVQIRAGLATTGAASASFTFTATATGKRTVLGSAAASSQLSATALGQRTVRGAASVAGLFSATAGGVRQVLGAASAAFGFTASATGRVPPTGLRGEITGPPGPLPGSVARKTIELGGTIR